MTKKPLYVINLGGDYGYYSDDVSWRGVERNKATKLTHKEAYKIANHLKQPKIGMRTSVEPA